MRDNSQDPKFCLCFNLKCGIHFIGLYLTLNTILAILQIYFIQENDYFDALYELILLILIIPFFIGFMLFLLYWFGCDSAWHRGRLPLAVLMGALGSLLVFIWIMIFILAIYPDDEIWMGTGPKAPDGQEELSYTKQSKDAYIVIQAGPHILNTIFYIIMWTTVSWWVEANRKHGVST